VELSVSQELQAFREEVLVFLEGVKSPRLLNAGARATSVFPDFETVLEWQGVLLKQGWLVPTWPEENGGAGWTQEQKSILDEEIKLAGFPSLIPMGLLMLGPMMLKYGSEEQKQELLPRLLSGDDIWCQGYSEPGSGSDLASLKTRAITDGDDYIVNGSKIWTSYAQHANKIFCLVKTDTECKPQAEFSFLLVDLDAPGITVDEIVSIDGEVEQCQVFFDDVRVPKINLVGDENQGWEVAKYLLEFERGGGGHYPGIKKQLASIKALAQEQQVRPGQPHLQDPVYADKLARLEIEGLALQYLECRNQCDAKTGSTAALSSMQKIVATELSQKLDELALDARGAYLGVHMNETLAPSYNGEFIGSELGAPVMNHYMNNRASTIYGGTAQIQRNIIAKLVLGL